MPVSDLRCRLWTSLEVFPWSHPCDTELVLVVFDVSFLSPPLFPQPTPDPGPFLVVHFIGTHI